MKRLTIMIKPASSLCDMRCKYCFYCDVAAARHTASMGIMTQATAAALIANVFSVLSAGDHVTFAFQGGEPTLAGLDFFTFFVETVKQQAPQNVRVCYALQTNGLMLENNENGRKWAQFFKEHGFLIGLSLDGDGALHNQNRMDAQGKGTFSRVMAAKNMLEKQGVSYNILCVLTAETARRAKRLWEFILRERIRHIQFIPCLESLDDAPDGVPTQPYALTGHKFYQFYAALFPLWQKEAAKGNLVHVRLFEDLIGLFVAGRPVTCGIGGRCTPQFIVEADGSVYPCDFYVLDAYKTGNLTVQNLKQVFEATVSGAFLQEKRPLPDSCRGCAYTQWCAGGCKRMAKAVYGKNCGMRLFLDQWLTALLATT